MTATVVTIDDRCTACGLCLVTCPDNVLVPAPRKPAVTGPCCGCLACIEVCPVDAFTARAAPPSRPAAPTARSAA